MKQRSELLTIRAEAEIIQFSEMVRGALYTSHERSYTGCVWTHAQIPENHWQCECSKSDDPGTNAGTHYPCISRNLCVKGALEMSGKMKRLKRKMEVQKITFNHFARPQPRNWNCFMQWWWWPYKKYCCLVSKCVVGVWDGLDESEISRPEILFQSAPVYDIAQVV